MSIKDKKITPPAELNKTLEELAEKKQLESDVIKARKKTDGLYEDFTNNEDLSLATILAGDALAGTWMKKNWLYLLFLVVLIIVYTSNRYACQQEQIETKRLNDELIDIRYKVLTTSSELRKHSRASIIEQHLKDSTLRPGLTPNFKIIRDELPQGQN